MDCGCGNRKTVMLDEGKPGRAEIYILAVAVGALVIAGLPKLPMSQRMQGVIYGTIVGTALTKAIDSALDKATNNAPTAVN